MKTKGLPMWFVIVLAIVITIFMKFVSTAYGQESIYYQYLPVVHYPLQPTPQPFGSPYCQVTINQNKTYTIKYIKQPSGYEDDLLDILNEGHQVIDKIAIGQSETFSMTFWVYTKARLTKFTGDNPELLSNDIYPCGIRNYEPEYEINDTTHCRIEVSKSGWFYIKYLISYKDENGNELPLYIDTRNERIPVSVLKESELYNGQWNMNPNELDYIGYVIPSMGSVGIVVCEVYKK